MTERLGGVRLTRALVQAGALVRDGAKDHPDLCGMVAFTALYMAAVGTGTLRLNICRCLLSHHHGW